MVQLAKTGAIVLLAVLSVAWSIWPANASRPQLRYQAEEPVLVEVASGPLGEPTLALEGRGDFSSESIFLYGFVTAVGGLDVVDLYTGDSDSRETARFTFVADLAVDSVETRADVTLSAASGTLRVYFNEAAGATWEDRDSFAAGQLVAEYSLNLRDSLHRQAPGVGLVVGLGQLVQTTSEDFALGDEQFRFGFADLQQRLRYLGALSPGTQSGQAYAASFTGKMVVSGRQAIIARVGGPESVVEEGTTPTASGDCAPFEPWLSESLSRLEQAGTTAASAAGDGTLESLDPTALQQASGEIAALVAAQREAAVPEEATAANRLTVTALSTYARGLQLLTDAADTQATDLLAQGQAALSDGGSLLTRATAEVSAVAPECVVGES